MEKNRETKIIAVTSMIIAVITLTIGFAVFSKNLNIQNMSATVKANEENFKVKFSSKENELDESNIKPAQTLGMYAGTEAIIDNSGPNPKISNLGFNVDFNDNIPYLHETLNDISYQPYAINVGEFDAYLKSIKINNVVGYDKPIVCLPDAGTSEKLVTEICDKIEYKVFLGNWLSNRVAVATTNGQENLTGISEKVSKKSLKQCGATEYDCVPSLLYSSLSFYISIYIPNIENVDGKYSIKFGDVELEFSTQ